MASEMKPLDKEVDQICAREIMGWTRTEGSGYHSFQDWWKGDPERRTCRDWRPTTDANHCREVEAEIERRGLVRGYIEALVPVVTAHEGGCECVDESGACELCWFAVAHATPAQRCRAALRAVREVEDG